MTEHEMSEILEICLARMQAGASIADVLEQFPVQAAELRPLLEAGWMAMLLAPPADAPSAAQNRSRAAFLARTGELRAHQRPRQTREPFFSFVLRYGALIVVLAAVLLGGGLVSARSLPGDLLYPLKINVERASQSWVADISSRLNRQLSFDERRAQEVRRLLQSGREEAVNFGGFLERKSENWHVADIPLRIAPDLNFTVDSMAGSYVDVQGTTTIYGDVQVENLSLRIFYIDGVIHTLGEGFWQVDGLRLGVTPQTQISGEPQAGSSVKITAVLLPGLKWMALTAQVDGAPLPPTASPTPEATHTFTPAPKAATVQPKQEAPTVNEPTPVFQKELVEDHTRLESPGEDTDDDGGKSDSNDDCMDESGGGGGGDDNGGDDGGGECTEEYDNTPPPGEDDD